MPQSSCWNMAIMNALIADKLIGGKRNSETFRKTLVFRFPEFSAHQFASPCGTCRGRPAKQRASRALLGNARYLYENQDGLEDEDRRVMPRNWV